MQAKNKCELTAT